MKEQESNFEETKIDLEAAEWVSKHARGLSAQEQDEFFSWMAEDPRHSEWYARHRQTWKNLDLLAQWKPEHSDKPNPDLLKHKRPVRRSAVWQSLAACLVAACAVWFFVSQGLEVTEEVVTQNYVAQAYEEHVLPDGSKLEMNDGAALKIRYSDKERRVELVSSEAHFEVEKDPAKPFVVYAKGLEFKAVGTAFSVKVENDKVELLVTEGTVEMTRVKSSSADSGPPVLDESTRQRVTAGEQSVASAESTAPFEVKQLEELEIDRLLSWKPRSLVFDQVPLEEIVAIFNQRNATQIKIEDEELKNTIVFASFRSARTASLIEILESTFDVVAQDQADGNILLTLSKEPEE